jgi:DNA-binding CsgD family transcriptional regulator
MHNLADVLFRATDAVYSVDNMQRIVYWNSACEQLFGIPCKNALGRLCSEVVRGEDADGRSFCEGGCCASLAKGGKGPKRFPLLASDSTGNKLQLSVNIVLVPTQNNDQWTCVHLLNSDSAIDGLQAQEYCSSDKRDVVKLQTGSANTPISGSNLTVREREILNLMTKGLRAKVISQLLHVSPVTVRNHIQHIVSKLEVHSQLEAVAYAYRHNLVQHREYQ